MSDLCIFSQVFRVIFIVLAAPQRYSEQNCPQRIINKTYPRHPQDVCSCYVIPQYSFLKIMATIKEVSWYQRLGFDWGRYCIASALHDTCHRVGPQIFFNNWAE